MKHVFKGNAPPLLEDYVKKHPEDNWKVDFKPNNRDGADEVKLFLRRDQRGLCAYCENDLRLGNGKGNDDFRVEHFFPENPKEVLPEGSPNYALMWDNMLGCCTGGNDKGVTESDKRFTKGDYSCDVGKANHNWTDIILNPISDILPEHLIFAFDDQTGEISVDRDSCPPHLFEKASESIIKLRLDSSRLNSFREEVLTELKDQLLRLEEEKLTEQEAMEEVAAASFSENSDEDWPTFFTMIRWYLGEIAEERLKEIGYTQ